jgi:hypothetical protein
MSTVNELYDPDGTVERDVLPPDPDDRIAAIEAELRRMRERAAAVTATGGAAAVRDAITGVGR